MAACRAWASPYTAKYLAQSLGLTGWSQWSMMEPFFWKSREASIYDHSKLLMGLNHNQFHYHQVDGYRGASPDKEEKSFLSGRVIFL